MTLRSCHESLRFLLDLRVLATSLMVRWPSESQHHRFSSPEAEPEIRFSVQIIYYRNVQGKLRKDGAWDRKRKKLRKDEVSGKNSTEGRFALIL